jgi:hypothetical protein
VGAALVDCLDCAVGELVRVVIAIDMAHAGAWDKLHGTLRERDGPEEQEGGERWDNRPRLSLRARAELCTYMALPDAEGDF